MRESEGGTVARTDGGLVQNPLEQQRQLMELLSQDTRHKIIQFILGHPENLASLAELQYMIGKTEKTISDQVENLVEADIVAEYRHEPNSSARALPEYFYGFTESGVQILDDFGYLTGAPMARAVYEQTRKNEKIERHESAPRPHLPVEVAKALEFEGPDTSNSS